MYLTEIEIENIRCVKHAKYRVTEKQAPGWHVILGVNGSGKSSILRMIALTLAGPTEGTAARPDLDSWLMQDESEGACTLQIYSDKRWDKLGGAGRPPDSPKMKVGLQLNKPNGRVLMKGRQFKPVPERHIWGDQKGWFSASFGPYRRFSGGNKDYEKLFYQYPILAPHLSIFGEDIALTESLVWLTGLRAKLLDARDRGLKTADKLDHLLNGLTRFINESTLLPRGVNLSQVTTEEVIFQDTNGKTLPVIELSDGYRSILSLTFELIRLMSEKYDEELFDSEDPTKIVAPGVVLIDEVDVHLHPSWQQEIGRWFRSHFPNIQFIVTTHSSFVCQAADIGTVWKLGTPGQGKGLRQLKGAELDRLIYGNILDAFSTGIFGEGNTRSPEADEKLRRLGRLNILSLERSLTAEEVQEQGQLRAMFPRFKQMDHWSVRLESKRSRHTLPEFLSLFERYPDALDW